MANQVLTYAITQFTDSIEFLAQQMPARLFDASIVNTYKGNSAVAVEQFGLTYASQITGRLQPITFTDTPADRRWIYPIKEGVADAVDSFEALELEISPQGSIAQAQMYAMNRKKDDVWIANFFGTASTGNTTTQPYNGPQNQIAFPASQQIASTVGSSGGATPVGLNVPKLRAARLLLLQNEVNLDYETPYAGLGGQQMDNMLNQAQAISLDFNDKPVLVGGKITSFMGFEFIHSERLLLNTAPARRIPIWVKSGMRAGIWQDITGDIRQRPDLVNFPYQIAANMMIGATRAQETKCVEVDCTEPG